MKINELIAELEHLAEYAGDDAEVMLAHQQSWPLQFNIGATTLVGNVIYIAEGSSPYDAPYAPRDAWVGGLAFESEDDF